jgi:hypothetical protein
MLCRVGILACISFGGISLAVADPPVTPAAPATASTPAAPATTSAPAAPTAATPAQTPAAPADADMQEKHFLAEGYKVEMRHGEKYFCRREDLLGSRLGGQKNCSTAQQLAQNEAEAKRITENAQHQQTHGPSGR